MSERIKNALFWPTIILLGLTVAYLVATRPNSPGKIPTVVANAAANGRNKPFDLLITRVIREKHKIELLEVEVEHWQLHQVEIKLLKSGVVRSTFLKYVPESVMRTLLKHNWNRSTAEIITSCKASVEFEVPFDKVDTWKITVDGDTARVKAPPFEVDEVNVRPETVNGWVAREDFLIDGETQKTVLMRNIQRVLQKKVNSKAFRNQHRESCRKSLEAFLLKQLSLLKATADVKHVIVEFSDDPEE